MNEDESWFIERISTEGVSESDIYGCIDTLEMLLSIDAVPAIVELIADEKKSMELRTRAATAVHNIGAGYAGNRLNELAIGASPEISFLIGLALTGK